MTEPTTVHIVKLLEKTSFRDGLSRTVQYGCKLIGWLMDQQGASSDTLKRAKALETSLSMARKLFRIGKSFVQLRVALQTVHLNDPVHCVLITLAKLSRAFFLFIDHLVWADMVQLVRVDRQKWIRRMAKFWFLAIVLGLLRDAYDLLRAVRAEYCRLKHDNVGSKTLSTAVSRAITKNPPLVLDIVKNSTDVFLPLSKLDAGRGLSQGWIGLMGVVSSLCSLMALWNETLKLKYS